MAIAGTTGAPLRKQLVALSAGVPGRSLGTLAAEVGARLAPRPAATAGLKLVPAGVTCSWIVRRPSLQIVILAATCNVRN